MRSVLVVWLRTPNRHYARTNLIAVVVRRRARAIGFPLACGTVTYIYSLNRMNAKPEENVCCHRGASFVGRALPWRAQRFFALQNSLVKDRPGDTGGGRRMHSRTK